MPELFSRDYFSYSVVYVNTTDVDTSSGNARLQTLSGVTWSVLKVNTASGGTGFSTTGTTTANIYAERVGGTALSPAGGTTARNGLIEFWAPPGEYRVVITDPLNRISQKYLTWNSVPGWSGGIPGEFVSDDEQISSTKITDLSVDSTKLASNAVTTAKITDLNVTTGKIADLAVTNAKIDNATIQQSKLAVSARVPVGAIIQYAGSSEPTSAGWSLCNGQALSRTTYSELFAVIGTAYGSGNGSTTFNVPDATGHIIKSSNVA